MTPKTRSRWTHALRVCTIAAVVAVLEAACGGNPTQPSIAFRQLRPLGMGGPFTCTPGVRIVRDAGEWTTLVAMAQFEQPPAINFNAEMVALISLGARPTSGYSVEALGARRSGGGLVIEAVEFTVGRCVALQVVTCPGAIVVVPRSSGAVGLEWGTARPQPGCE